MAHKTGWLLGGLLCLSLLPAFAHAQSPERMEEIGKIFLENLERELGPDSTGTAFFLIRQAGYIRAQGRYAEAESFHKRALAIREKEFFRDNPRTAHSLHNLALVYQDQGRHAEAETKAAMPRPSPYTYGRWRSGRRAWVPTFYTRP